MYDQGTLTRLLDDALQGGPDALTRLWQAVYTDLRSLAASKMNQEHGHRTIQPTALVNEVYLRFFTGPARPQFENRRHFFAAAARAMHQILVDDARTRRRLKRGGDRQREQMADLPAGDAPDPAEILAVDEALARLGDDQPDWLEVVRLRYFVGLNLDEAAEVLGVSRRTVATRWRLAKAWLHEAMTAQLPENGGRPDCDNR